MKHFVLPVIFFLMLATFNTSVLAVTQSSNPQAAQINVHDIQPYYPKKKRTRSTTVTHTTQNTNPAYAVSPPGSYSGGPTLLPTTGTTYLPVDLDAPGQAFVTSGPFIGLPIEYSGSDLIINTPNINEDVTLLRLRKNIIQRFEKLGIGEEHYHSHLLLSGEVEGQIIYRNIGQGGTQSDIDLTDVEFAGFVLGPSSWTSAYFDFAYDNDTSAEFNSRVLNSRMFVNKAFIIIGDFNKSPFYGSIGQMFVPFGAYHSNMVSSTLPKLLGRTKARALNIGYQGQGKSALFTSAYIFRGPSYPSPNQKNRINNGGIQLGYRSKGDNYNYSIGSGVIGTISDSLGMQFTGNSPLFDGFAGPDTSTGAITGNELLVHRVPAYDIRGLFGFGGHWDFLAEFVTASTRFNPNDMTYNGHGAKPKAVNAEAAYSFDLYSHPSTVAVGYGQSSDALAIGLPKKRIGAVFNTSLWRDTIESLEIRDDVDYPHNSTSSGSTVTGPTGTGTSNYVVTAQMDLYF